MEALRCRQHKFLDDTGLSKMAETIEDDHCSDESVAKIRKWNYRTPQLGNYSNAFPICRMYSGCATTRLYQTYGNRSKPLWQSNERRLLPPPDIANSGNRRRSNASGTYNLRPYGIITEFSRDGKWTRRFHGPTIYDWRSYQLTISLLVLFRFMRL
ncbi:hypothetical protein Trydic_g20115 [Trypoxylus dichotomus]